MQVQINHKRVRLGNSAVIGTGGEATIFQHARMAIKIYLAPDRTRAQKLVALLPKSGLLPDSVIGPQELVYDAQGKNVIGFTMRLLDPHYVEIRELTKKKYRIQSGVDAKDVACLFLKIGQILQKVHQAGMVVGDLNDLNLMFHDDQVLFIDVDSFQFDHYPCMVGTEAFTDPQLYGIDLAVKPVFTTDHDWYAYAVLLFKSLLLTHPYGGIHPGLKLLPHRAQQRISVFDKDVTYPKIAYSPELLSDELAYEFQAWFERGKRGVFPLNLLHDYVNQLVTCPHCAAPYPRNRSQCPICTVAIPVAMSMAVSGSRVVIRTGGEIIAWQITQHEARVIAHESGKAVLYVMKGTQQIKRMVLFDAIPTARYAFVAENLVISPQPASDELLLVDVSGDKPQGLQKLTTALFGQGERIFGANNHHLYRIANGYLMRGEFRYGQYVEKAMMAVADQQTWFSVAPDDDRVFGFFRTFNNYDFWLLKGQERIDMALPSLERFEFMTEISVKFAANSVLILRQTQYQGVERVRIDELSMTGQVLHSSITRDVDQFTPLDAHVYASNMLLIAEDNGVVRRMLDNANTTTFTQTEHIVKSGDRLFRYADGLFVLGDSTGIFLTV